MPADKKSTINVKGTAITVLSHNETDYISLTDMVKGVEGGSALIVQWLKNKDTIIFLGAWEQMYNPDFKSLEFERIRNEAGRNSFFLTAKGWIDRTNAHGLIANPGRYGGTYAHRDIAFEFGTWISPEFKLYLIKEFQRLKEDDSRRQSLEWNLHRTLSKINFRIHTDAIKEHIIPNAISPEQASYMYANESDVLNVALFGKTAKQWHEQNPDLDGNMRDYATVEQLLVLANIESMNAEFIRMGLAQSTRLANLNSIARQQLRSLTIPASLKNLNTKPLKSEDDE